MFMELDTSTGTLTHHCDAGFTYALAFAQDASEMQVRTIPTEQNISVCVDDWVLGPNRVSKREARRVTWSPGRVEISGGRAICKRKAAALAEADIKEGRHGGGE